jgi:hypothetical protein
MENVWVLACAWVVLAFIATLQAIYFPICAHISFVVGADAIILTPRRDNSPNKIECSDRSWLHARLEIDFEKDEA